MAELLDSASRIGIDGAVKNIDGGTGIAVRSIRRKVWAQRMSARVYTTMSRPRAMSIEKGRKRGEGETIEKLASWYKGIPYRRRMHISHEDRSSIIQIWKSVREHGVKGKGYIVAAKDAIEEELPRLTRAAMARLKEMARR
jgi:hypothetical protein